VRPQASLRSRLGVRFSLAREMLARRGRKMASGRILAASVATPQKKNAAVRRDQPGDERVAPAARTGKGSRAAGRLP